jgi:hypothetical protein
MTWKIVNFYDYTNYKNIDDFQQEYSVNEPLICFFTDGAIRGEIAKYIQQVLDLGYRVQWILDERFQQWHMPVTANILYLNNIPLTMYLGMYEQKISQPNTQWNSNTNKFLFLTGKPEFLNRARLLYRFYQENLLDNCVWSLFMDKALYTSTRELFQDLDDQAYDQFIKTHLRNPDNIEVVFNSSNTNTCHYVGMPFDSTLYASTSFRVVAETWQRSVIRITEKTWLTVANRQPFIMAALPGMLDHARLMGLKTFENYLPRPDYDTIPDWQQREDAIVENIKYWLSNIHKHQAEIQQDVEHNYQVFEQHASSTLLQLGDIVARADLPNVQFLLSKFFDLSRGWTQFYYSVKDPSWPDCFSEKDFVKLDKRIQDELTTVYGYTPGTYL